MARLMTRREFLKVGGLVVLLSGIGGSLMWELFKKTGAIGSLTGTQSSRHALVVVQLSGGNDGLNTVVPFTNGVYYDARPRIAIAQRDVLQLTNEFGLHPNMNDLQALYRSGHVAVVQGVGYPNPILSHFRSMAVWHTGDPTVRSQTGWLGRFLDVTAQPNDNPLRAISLSSAVPLALSAKKSDTPAMTRPTAYRLEGDVAGRLWNPGLSDAMRGMYANSTGDDSLAFVRGQGKYLYSAMDEVHRLNGKMTAGNGYPKSALGQQLEVVAELMGAGAATEVYYTQMGGFDDHAGEESHHGATLGDFSASVGAFMRDLERRGLGDRATILAFSEFGRRVKENGSMGTDHGEAGPVFFIGKRVKGGFYGDFPNMNKQHDGDLPYTVDFRSVYATALDKVLGAPSKDILGATYEPIPCIAT